MIVLICRDSAKYKSISRRNHMVKYEVAFAGSPNRVRAMDPKKVTDIWDVGDSYLNRRYEAIKEACEEMFPNAKWSYPE